MKGYLAENLARFISKTDYRSLPGPVIHQARRCLLDFIGAALAGSHVGLAPLVKTLISALRGREEATIIGERRRLPALHAAFVNGVAAHTLDMDDGHRFANGHPGVAIIPAALAMGEREDVTGRELIEGIVVGYEIFIRLAAAINPSHLKRGFHTTGTVGPFGAVAACSKILKLNQEETKNGIGIAGLQGAGLLEVMEAGQMMKPLHPGKAAQAGVLAALLAREGAEGPGSIFEGGKGFWRAFSDEGLPQNVSNHLGKPFEILNIYFKKYAACRHIHPTLDTLKAIVDKNGIDIRGIDRIDVHTYSVAYDLTGRNRKARREMDAKFSLPLSVGLMCVYGKAGVEQYSMKCLGNPLVRRIAEKVAVTVDPERDELYPRERSSRVDVVTSKGTFSDEVRLPKGDPENPFSDEDLKEKFLQNASQVLNPKKTEEIQKVLFQKQAFQVRELMKLVRRFPG